jgi:surfeit locus 1 family protein
MKAGEQGSPFEDTTLEDRSAAAAPASPATALVEGNAPIDPLESDGSLADALNGMVKGTWQTLPKLVNRKWWWVTLLAIAGVGLLVWLGIWQLDRLEQRRAFNAMVAERWLQTPFDLQHEALPDDLETMGYRRVAVQGAFDYDNQIVLTNQPNETGEPGVQMITPFVLDDGRAVLVSRGWVPQYLAGEENWQNLQEPADRNEVIGLIQRSQELNGATAPPQGQREWYTLNIPLIQQQMPYELLPVFIMQLPDAGLTASQAFEQYPYRTEPIALDEGSHFSYAIQWFMFAAILGIGYIQWVRWQEERTSRLARQEASLAQDHADYDDAEYISDSPEQNDAHSDIKNAQLGRP